MAVSLKAFIAISAIIGSCTSFPVFFNSSNSTTVLRKLSTVAGSNAGVGNCEVEKISKDLENFLSTKGKEGDLYVGVLCENTSVETGSGSLSHAWTGIFPSKLLANSDKLAIGKKLEIKTKTTSQGETTSTIFEESGMAKAVTGAWGERITKGVKTPITPISISENPNETNVYLISH